MEKVNIGGQAVIEGVMIRGPKSYAVAVRKNSKIVYKKAKIKKKHAILSLPFIRGSVNLFEMLVIGMKTLMWSAQQSMPKEEKIGKNDILIAILISLLAVIIFFIALPYAMTYFLGFSEEKRPILFNIVD